MKTLIHAADSGASILSPVFTVLQGKRSDMFS